jgi:NADPH:quinone reductase-like Zn-dependent oxidoreductase
MRDTKILVTGAAGATGWTAIKMRMELKAFVRAVVHGKDTRSEQRSVQGEHAGRWEAEQERKKERAKKHRK